MKRLDWPGNFPDLNAIEPCWSWMKRMTTKEGGFKTWAPAEKVWIKCWDDLEQSKIQHWIALSRRSLSLTEGTSIKRLDSLASWCAHQGHCELAIGGDLRLLVTSYISHETPNKFAGAIHMLPSYVWVKNSEKTYSVTTKVYVSPLQALIGQGSNTTKSRSPIKVGLALLLS